MSEESQNDGKKNVSVETASGVECSTHCDASTNISQSNIPAQQVTASTAPPGEAAKWNCEICTYENFPLSRKCTMCRSPKPLLGEDIFTLQAEAADGASALPAAPSPVTDRQGAQGVSERLRPLRISSPPVSPGPALALQPQPAHTAAPAHTKWPCPRCTYENWPRSMKCAMCGALGPQPVATNAAQPGLDKGPRTPIGINELCNSQNLSLHDNDAKLRSKRKNTDWIWLQACLGVVDGSAACVETYLAMGGDPARALTPHEVALLNRASAFGAGHTLVHLAIRFQREDILAMLLSRISGGGPGLKRSPSYIAPDLASAIRRHVASCLRTKRQGPFHCTYINEMCTFALPQEIEELPAAIQEQLFAELLDRDAQHTLEADPPLINWSLELTLTLGSRLYALWNRSAGDCLLDAVLQAAYGVFDRDNTLRAALADTLHHAHRSFYERWVGWERLQASLLHYQPEESQLRAEWSRLLSAAARPGTPLHQVHVFALAHVMRRPIIVYGVNVVHSFRGEALGYARYQGIYLPLLWEPESCSKSPLCVGYTRGHFSALVALEPYTRQYICDEQRSGLQSQEEDGEGEVDGEEAVFLPLCDAEGKPLPVHFLTRDEMVDEETLVRRWVGGRVTRGGLAVARQAVSKPPLLVAQMCEEWLNHYRTIAQQTRGPFPPRLNAEFSSDPDTDEE